MGKALDRIDRRILRYVADYTAKRGYPPATREIASEIRRSLSTTQTRLAFLERDGAISRERNLSRTVRVTVVNL